MPSVINQFVEYYDSNQSISSANCRLASTTLLFDHPQLDENQFNPVQENKELQKLVQDFRSTEFTRAAQLLFDLSVNRSSLLTLTKRMELLSKALVCLNSAQNEIGRVRGEICEKMDLAVIQQKMRLVTLNDSIIGLVGMSMLHLVTCKSDIDVSEYIF